MDLKAVGQRIKMAREAKGLTQEDIDTKNDRWLQYMMMLEMQAEWDAREAAAKAAEEAEKAEQA